jgi:hypothetical protein
MGSATLRGAALLLLSGLTGCAFGPGEPLALVEASLRAEYLVPEDRASADGFARLSSDYQVRIDTFTLEIEAVELRGRQAGGGGAGGTFDPANPPPGYSLCHSGHCHRDDGELIPYEDIRAELARGGVDTVVVVMTLPVGRAYELMDGEVTALECEPDCALGEVPVSSMTALVRDIRIEGVVRDARQPSRLAGEVAFTLTAPVELTLAAPLQLPADRATPPLAVLEVGLRGRPQLFDGVDWSVLAGSAGVVEMDASRNPEAFEQVLESFGSQALRAEVTRKRR